MPSVQLIYRKTNPLFFSIEKVFASLIAEFRKKYSVEETYLPHYSSSLNDIQKNIKYAGKVRTDIYHITGDVHYAVIAFPAKKTILTIHDSVFLRESRGLKKFFFKWIFLKFPVKKARYVTTISQKSKEEIVRYTHCDPAKVVVIPNPINEAIYFKEKEFNERKPRLLFIGSTPNKNLERIIPAIAGISCLLEIVGRIPGEHRALLKKYEIEFQQFSRLTETEMADRYAAADIILFPSLYEGFGLPILEGQKAGRVVLTSNIAPMANVSGSGACLVDPLDGLSIRNGLLKIIQDTAYRNQLVKNGFENILQYDVKRISAQYMDLYEKILHS